MDGEIRNEENETEIDDDGGFETLSVRWIGSLPLLMHNEQLANPLHPLTMQMAALAARPVKEKKTTAHVEAMTRVEWEGGLYFDEAIGPYIPGNNILACIRDAAKFQKLGKTVTQVCAISDGMVPLEYKGPRDLDGMWAARMVDVRGVKLNGRTKVQRARPIFHAWSVAFSVRFISEKIDRSTMIQIMREAGTMVGLGDFKQRFGRFTVEVSG